MTDSPPRQQVPHGPRLSVRRKLYHRLRRPPLDPLRPPVEPNPPASTPEDPSASTGEALRIEVEALRIAESEARRAYDRRDAEAKRLSSQVEDLRRKLEKEARTAEQARAQANRARAEMDNQRKRLTREREEVQRFAAEKVLRELFAPLEHLRLALESFDKDANAASLRDGVTMVHREVFAIVRAAGLSEIAPAPGEQFDPREQEAVSTLSDPARPEGAILRLIRPGFRLHDKVLRPALVEVNTPEPGSQPAPEPPGPPRQKRRSSSHEIKKLTEPLERARRMLDSRFDIEDDKRPQ